MMRVGLARCRPSYAGLKAPWGPGKSYPEVARLLGEEACGGPMNEVYAAVRAALFGLGLDSEHYGSESWNPIGDLVGPGKRIILKPNLIRHWNPAEDGRGGTVDSVITHGSVIRAVASKPALVLADEPTANLDSVASEALLDVMYELNQELGVTFVFATHDSRVMERSRRLVRMVDGAVDSDETRR